MVNLGSLPIDLQERLLLHAVLDTEEGMAEVRTSMHAAVGDLCSLSRVCRGWRQLLPQQQLAERILRRFRPTEVALGPVVQLNGGFMSWTTRLQLMRELPFDTPWSPSHWSLPAQTPRMGGGEADMVLRSRYDFILQANKLPPRVDEDESRAFASGACCGAALQVRARSVEEGDLTTLEFVLDETSTISFEPTQFRVLARRRRDSAFAVCFVLCSVEWEVDEDDGDTVVDCGCVRCSFDRLELESSFDENCFQFDLHLGTRPDGVCFGGVALPTGSLRLRVLPLYNPSMFFPAQWLLSGLADATTNWA